MKHRLIILLSLVLLPVASMAQTKYFIYVRYDPTEGNSEAIINKIDRVVRTNPEKLIVVLSWGANPQVATDANGWKEIRNSILTQPNAFNPPYDVEEDTMNNLFAQHLNERVRQREGQMKIYGRDDEDWTVWFVLSEKMYEREEYEIIPLEFYKINQLNERELRVHWYSYGDSDQLKELAEPSHPFYK